MADEFFRNAPIPVKSGLGGFLGSLIPNLLRVFRFSKWRIQNGGYLYQKMCSSAPLKHYPISLIFASDPKFDIIHDFINFDEHRIRIAAI